MKKRKILIKLIRLDCETGRYFLKRVGKRGQIYAGKLINYGNLSYFLAIFDPVYRPVSKNTDPFRSLKKRIVVIEYAAAYAAAILVLPLRGFSSNSFYDF